MKSTLNFLNVHCRLVYRLYSSSTANVAGRSFTTIRSNDGQRPSYFHGESSSKLLGITMCEVIDMAPDRFGDNLAIVDRFHGIRKTFVEFKKEIDQVAMGFLALNLKRGDMLGIWCPNRYEWVLAQMAAAKAGLILATVNPALQAMELEYILKMLQLKAIVIPESFKTQNYYEMISNIVPEIKDSKSGKINSKKHPYFTSVIMITDKNLPGIFKFKDLYSAGGSNEKNRLDQLQKEIQIDDDFNLQFTSGTTGRPKGATLSHFSVVNDSHIVADRLGYYEELCKRMYFE